MKQQCETVWYTPIALGVGRRPRRCERPAAWVIRGKALCAECGEEELAKPRPEASVKRKR
jgi:hypothetical protein